MNHPIQVAPSILAADFAGLAEDVRRVEAAGADLLHLDVMDGSFVPNISFGPAIVSAIHSVATKPLDVHLMIDEPIRYLDRFAASDPRFITVHVEACSDMSRTLDEIERLGALPGITLRPGTDFATLEPYLNRVDLVLIMTVEPGFGGQSYLRDQEAKMRRAAELRAKHGYRYAIEVDGGIGAETAASAVRAGAEILVAGTSVFGATDPAGLIAQMHDLEAVRAS